MGALNMPAPEIDITVGLVKALVSEQFPDLADLDVRRLSNTVTSRPSTPRSGRSG